MSSIDGLSDQPLGVSIRLPGKFNIMIRARPSGATRWDQARYKPPGQPLIPLSSTLMLAVFPKSKANIALALWGMVTVVAPIFGPILGGLIFSFAQDEFGARGLTQLLTGIAIVLFIVVFPRGVVGGLWSAVRARGPGGQPETS